MSNLKTKFNENQYEANNSCKRYVIHQGGTGSGKTFSVLQYLLVYMCSHQGKVISVVAESLPHLKRGALRDFKRIMGLSNWTGLLAENRTDHTFSYCGNLLEFFSADDEARLRGARRDVLYINECNNIDYESFQQLDVRTRYQTILDFNPTRRFWVHDQLLPSLQASEYCFLKSTYLDNKFLTAGEKANIERRRNNESWWKVYGEGEIGLAEGLVFSNWTITASPPSKGGSLDGNSIHPLGGRRGAVYGIDFGFTHSPTAIVALYEENGELYVHELLYRSGVQNDELFEFAKRHIDLNALAVADSAEPKTIDYLYRKGWTGLKAAAKGSDSVEFGINLLLDRKIKVTAESVNLIKELRQYMWDTNRDGAFVRRPVKDFDHAIDALRYAYSYPKRKKLMFS